MSRTRTARRESAGQGLLFADALTEQVTKLARDPGFILVGPAETVHTRHVGTRAAEHAVPARPDIAATVHHLLAAGHLHHGTRTTVTVDGRTDPEAATVIEAPAATTGPPSGERVRVFVDVVRPGHGLVTADGFSGQIVRQDGTYLVETDAGEVIGRARSFRAGAERLARHHGLRADPVEVDHEHKHHGAQR
jgi:hypothetical protein